jgi:hypothetical protein
MFIENQVENIPLGFVLKADSHNRFLSFRSLNYERSVLMYRTYPGAESLGNYEIHIDKYKNMYIIK